MVTSIRQGVATLANSLLDAVLPPRCPGCGAMVERQGALCPACWAQLRFIAEPCCQRCAVPVLHAPAGSIVCPACIVNPPVFGRARAVLRYDAASAPMILAMKHRGKLQAMSAFGGWMARAGTELFAGADGFVPVPLHRWRMLRRGFNQSSLLARAIGKRTGIPALAGALARLRATPSQQGLSGDERLRNMAGSVFAVPASARSLVDGRRLIVVDDVFTTGSTLSACAAALIRAGAANVDVLVLARVVRDDPMPILSTD